MVECVPCKNVVGVRFLDVAPIRKDKVVEYREHVESFMAAHPDAPRDIVENVNREIDQFAHYPKMEFLSRHRQFLHHKEGIEYFRLKYGYWGGRAATEHVRQDTGHVPSMNDYALGLVDNYGGRR